MSEAEAPIISVMDGTGKYAGEKIVTISCPFCRQSHKHRGAQLGVRQARCDEAKVYRITRWRQP